MASPAATTRPQQAAQQAVVFADGIGDYDSWEEYMRDVEQSGVLSAWVWGGDKPTRYTAEENAEYRRGMKALRLAPTLEVYRALLEGQPVPVDALDQRWRKRYGL